jgi:hypothetical protein
MQNKLLPLGSIIKLEKYSHTLMIIGRVQLFKQKRVLGYFDYSAVSYPEGLVSRDELTFFNDEDIFEVISEGYKDEQEEKYLKFYDKEIKNVTFSRLNMEDFKKKI